jgi:acyl carrier protein
MKTSQSVNHFRNIRSAVREYILSNFMPGEDEDNFQDDDLLFESGIIDSAGALTFISFLENRFGIEVTDEDLYPENFASVVQIVNFTADKLQTK